MQSLGQRYSVAVCACAFTRASSFTLLSVRGVLCSVQFLVFFSLPPLPLALVLSLYCYLIIVGFPLIFWVSVTGARAGAGFGGRGSWLGCG